MPWYLWFIAGAFAPGVFCAVLWVVLLKIGHDWLIMDDPYV
jgi:hypothetical protein